MAQNDSHNLSIARWGIASRTLDGESDSGDRHLVLERPGELLIAVVDGAGHGPDAAVAAQLAVDSLLRAPATAQATELVNHCHEQLRGTRGGVLSLGLIRSRDNSLSWLGVGNVEATVFSATRENPAHLLLRSGVVGMWLPPLKAYTLELVPGDTVIFATDGVDNRFADEVRPDDKDPQTLAESILRDYGRRSDDALALVLRYTGTQA
jgi:phosphoserine phosphatase RsbX